MENRHGDTEADFPTGGPGLQPGYLAYLDSLGSRRENPSSLIVAGGEQAVLRVVRACGAVLGPVYHLADPDHAAIRAAVARLEATGPVLGITGGRILLTSAGEVCRCPFCGVFGSAGAGWRSGVCPTLAGAASAGADQLTIPVLSVLHVLIDEICGAGGAPGVDAPLGYSIDLSAPMPERTQVVWGAAEPLGVCLHRGHP